MSHLISRRAALLGGAGVVVGAAATLFDASSNASAAPQNIDRTAGAAADRMPEGFTDLAGVQAEYAEATRNWPFAQPEEHPLSRASSFTVGEDSEDAHWEFGSGIVQAHFDWASATAAAAMAAHSSGDAQASQEHLVALVSAYDSDLVRSVTDDPERNYVRMLVEPALHGGNYTPLADFYQLA